MWGGRRADAAGGRRPAACVMGEIDLVRALGLARIRSAVVVDPGNPARYSRSTAHVLPYFDSRTEPEARVAAVVAYAERQSEKPVLFYDNDWSLLLVSRHRARLASALHFVVPEPDLVEALVDKERFQELSERLSLPVPRARRVRLSETVEVDLRYPLVVKPLTRDHATWRPVARAKAIRVGDPAALRELGRRLAGSALDVLLQEEVPGPESRIESYHVYADADGAIAGEFTGRKLRTYPQGFGYTSALEITSARDVADLGRELTRRLGLRGVAKLDFKRDDEGRLHLLEVNPRFNLWHHPGALAGVNLPALVYADLTGGARPGVRPARAGVRWCSLAHDLQAARLEGWSVTRWLRWVARCEAKSGLALADPLPLARGLAWRVAHRRD